MEALKGFVLPMGLHKGFGLAVAIDILSGVLTGSGFSDGVKSMLQQWNEPQHIGHFFITIDPSLFMKFETFENRMKNLYKKLKSARRISSDVSIHLPGERSAETEKHRMKHGIPIDVKTLENLHGFAQGEYDYEAHKY
jgi:LDH2 family malate/lactate/ureidoglycolate dehydrogenase